MDRQKQLGCARRARATRSRNGTRTSRRRVSTTRYRPEAPSWVQRARHRERYGFFLDPRRQPSPGAGIDPAMPGIGNCDYARPPAGLAFRAGQHRTGDAVRAHRPLSAGRKQIAAPAADASSTRRATHGSPDALDPPAAASPGQEGRRSPDYLTRPFSSTGPRNSSAGSVRRTAPVRPGGAPRPTPRAAARPPPAKAPDPSPGRIRSPAPRPALQAVSPRSAVMP